MASKSSSKLLLRVLIALAVLIAAGWVVTYFMRPVAVVAAAAPGRAGNFVPGSVTVVAEYRILLKTEIAGRVVRSELDPGRTVKKGDFLVAIDTGDLELDIQRIENDLEAHQKRMQVGSALKIELENAKDELAAVERLVQLGNKSSTDLVRQQRATKQIEQKVALEEVENKQKGDTLENLLKVKRRQLAKMTMLAPFDGVVSQVFARVGDLIDNNAPIAEVIATSRTVEARISEENFSGIRVGQKASVRFLGYGTQLYGASVAKVLPTADPETQRYIVHIDVDLPPEKLVPGLTGEVNIVLGERDSKTNIPRRALRGSDVLVVKDGKVQRRTVKVGYVALNSVEILEGLQPGDEVIVEELERFQAGDRVRSQTLSTERR
jgi:RND family efflux transporter MFP subunit